MPAFISRRTPDTFTRLSDKHAVIIRLWRRLDWKRGNRPGRALAAPLKRDGGHFHIAHRFLDVREARQMAQCLPTRYAYIMAR